MSVNRDSVSVKNHFDEISTDYSQNFSTEKSGTTFDFKTRLELVSKNIPQQSTTFLDCACGTGEITAEVLSIGNFQTAFLADISGSMMARTRERLKGMQLNTELHYRVTDIFDFSPKPEVKFDVILCLGLLAHIQSGEKLFCLLKKLLNANGIIILQSSISSHFGIKLTRILTERKFYKRHGYGISYYNIKDISQLARLSNLKITGVHRYNLGIPFGDRISKIVNYYVEVLMRKYTKKYGADGIFLISHDDQ